MGDPIAIGAFLAFLLGTYVVGSWIEHRHYRTIRQREQRWRRLPVVTFRQVPAGWRVEDSGLVTGNVVISVDYFKRVLAGLRALVGGPIKSYELLLDRARREALLRLKQEAMQGGFHAVINVRIDTSRLANGRGGDGTAGVEVLVVGTGLKLASPPG